LLRVRNLRVEYGHIRALKGIDFHVEEGEIVTLIGANGAGKTTTVKAVSGLVPVAGGTIVLSGADITGRDPRHIVKAGVSHCPEGRQIFPRMTVLENLELGAYTRDGENLVEDYERIYSYFPVIKERQRQIAGTLSGGEQQMLAMGRALMSRPRLLLLDEPSLGLAPMLVDKIFEIIQTIHREGVTVLLIEQNAFRALQVAQRGYVLETGQVTLSGSAPEMLASEHVKKAYLGE
jgi:branched-chain amino acid transport system ATP-binding protein